MAYTVAAVMGSGKSRQPELTDFLVRWAPRRRQTAEEQLNIFRALAAAFEQKG